MWGIPIELYIGTRGRTGNATCTNATEPQGGTRAILYEGNIEYKIRGVLIKHTLCGLKKLLKTRGCIKVVSWGLGYWFKKRMDTHAMIYCPK